MDAQQIILSQSILLTEKVGQIQVLEAKIQELTASVADLTEEIRELSKDTDEND